MSWYDDSGGGGGGVSDHDDLGAPSLVWTASAHTGTVASGVHLAAFDAAGAAVEVAVSSDVVDMLGAANDAAIRAAIGAITSAEATTIADTQIAAGLTAHTLGPDPVVTSYVTVYASTFTTGTTQPASMTDASMTGLTAGGSEAVPTLGVVATSFASGAAETGTGANQGGFGSAASSSQPYNTTDFPGKRVPVALYKSNGQELVLKDVLSTAVSSYPASTNQPVYAYASYRSDLAADAKWRLWYYFRDAATGNETPVTPDTTATSVSVLVPVVKYTSQQTVAERRGRGSFSGEAAELAAGSVPLDRLVDAAASTALGRASGTGARSDFAFTDAAKTVVDDTTVGAMVDTLGGAASTGTGGLVRKTSAALVTPDLGTPSAGVLTNCTGLPNAGILNATATPGASKIPISTAGGVLDGWISTPTSSVAGLRPVQGRTITICARGTTSTVAAWTNQPAATTEFYGVTTLRQLADLSGCTQMRISHSTCGVVGVAGAKAGVQYSTDGGTTWIFMDGSADGDLGTETPQVAIDTLVTQSSAWMTLASGARTEVLLRGVGDDGNATADPTITGFILEVR